MWTPNRAVLIVDDEESVLSALERALRRADLEIHTASRGAEAVEMLDKKEFAVVICDQKMPGMTGAEFMRVLIGKQPDAKRVMLTGFADMELLLSSINELKISRILLKPWDNGHLRDVAVEAVEHFNLTRANKELEKELKFTQFAVDRAVDAVCWFDEFGTLLYMNSVMREFFEEDGKRKMDENRKVFAEFFKQEEWRTFFDEIKETGERVLETDLIGVGDERMPYEVCFKYLAYEGKGYVCAFARNIMERKRMEEMRETIDQIVRHDLKTPLNGIIGIPSLLSHEPNLNLHQKKMLSHIEETGYKMLKMINLSLDLYKMETGAYRFQPQSVNIGMVLERVRRDLNALFDYKKVGLKVMVNGEPSGEHHVYTLAGDELLCYSMLSNLVKNAVEAAPEKSEVVVSLTHGEVKDLSHVVCGEAVSELPTHKRLKRISIQNQGMVPEKIGRSFFDKFSSSGKTGGTGLGTYSAALIAKTHQGGIFMETSEEQGTIVSVFIPIYRNEDEVHCNE